MNETEFKTIVCNYAVGRSATSKGARAYLVGGWGHGAWERVRVLARSRGGRWIEIWEDTRHLTNFRLTTVVSESPDFERLKQRSIFGSQRPYTPAWMQELCDMINRRNTDILENTNKEADD